MVIFYENDRGKEGVWGRETQLIIVSGNSTEFPLDIRRCHNCVTTDDVKAWMRRYADLLREADLLRARADAIRSRAASPPTSALDGLPRSPGFEGDNLGGVIGVADALERQAAEKASQAATAYAEIDAAIQQINGKKAIEIQTALQCRYLDGLPWAGINFLLYGDRKNFSEREDTYLHYTFNFQKQGLEALAAILEMEEQPNE